MSLPDDFLAQLPVVIAAAIQTRLPALRTCEAIEGDFDATELRRVSKRAPAVLVAVLGLNQVDDISWQQNEVAASMAAFVVTRNHTDLSARASAWAITQAIVNLIPENAWGLPACGPAGQMRQRPMINADTRAAQVHLSTITWTQPLVLQPYANAAPINPQVYISRAPAIGADNEDDYTPIGDWPTGDGPIGDWDV